MQLAHVSDESQTASPQLQSKGHVEADEIHSARGYQIAEKYCNTPELREAALEAVRVAAQKRWNHMNGIYWFAVHGKEDDTPES